MRRLPCTLVVCLVLASGCQPTPPPEPPVAPPPEDLSQWTVPALVQPDPALPGPQAVQPAVRPATAAETVYTYAPGEVYKVAVALDAPLDVILEAGEKVQTLIGSDPKPIEPGQDPQQLKQRWDYREGVSGLGDRASARIFLRAMEAGATLGLTVTTSKRVYYLACHSIAKARIRAVRWDYPAAPEGPAPPDATPTPLLPNPQAPRQYHVGYQLTTSRPAPAWTPRQVVDDGKKLYLLYPEVTLFGTVPLVRAVGPSGPHVVNSLQFLNVVIVDVLAPKLELRVGTGDGAELVTITRSALKTITCPEDPACPQWPAAARHLTGRQP